MVIAPASLSAQENGADSQAAVRTGKPAYFEIVGIADNDLLNLRATASAGGMVIGRLPNGSRVKNLGCTEVKAIAGVKSSTWWTRRSPVGRRRAISSKPRQTEPNSVRDVP